MGDDPLPPVPRHAVSAKKAKKTQAPAVTTSAWAKQANTLCRTALAEWEKVEEPKSGEELNAYFARLVDTVEKLVTDIEALPRPPAERRRIAALVALGRRTVATGRRAQAALVALDLEEYARLMDVNRATDRKSDRIAVRLGANACAVNADEPKTPVERALAKHRVVVVALYAPGAAFDRLAIREARAGANEVDVGFVAVDVGDSAEIASVADESELRKSPAVLVMRRWIGAVSMFPGFVDRETVAQAAANAKA